MGGVNGALERRGARCARTFDSEKHFEVKARAQRMGEGRKTRV
jgi:uncharacterized protein (DUF2141 family)